jgi:hypothetical protein
MGHVRKGRQARARRQESAVARQAVERARSTRPDVPRASGSNVYVSPGRFYWAPLGTEYPPRWRGGEPSYMTRSEILRMLAEAVTPRDHNWWLKVTDV